MSGLQHHADTTHRSQGPRPGKSAGLFRRLAGSLADSPAFRHGKRLWEANKRDRNLPFSKADKVWAGLYLLVHDYATGLFPPVFTDQRKLHADESAYRNLIPGTDPAEVARAEMLKPFWFLVPMERSLRGFLQFARALERVELRPPAKLLELGGGAGWLAEFLAQAGFNVVSTTISPDDVQSGRKRVEALRLKGVAPSLEFLLSPMESVADQVGKHSPFDAVFVFEALHHAFDWRAAISSSFTCLRPGGWLLICNEPNVLHTAISYRVARLTSTHDIGFSKRELVRHLKHTGFCRVLSFGKRPHLFLRSHWLLARKP